MTTLPFDMKKRTQLRIKWSIAIFIILLLACALYFTHHYLSSKVENNNLSNAYLTMALSLLIVWLLTVIIFLYYMILKYQPLDHEDSPYLHETLGLPPGLFRAVLTVTLLFTVVLLEGYALTNIQEHVRIKEILDPLLTAFQLMIAFYFGTKIAGVVSGDKGKTDAQPKG
ncbi:MAG: hypothetical protein ACOY90_13540 [Candidatus Zhuqueibacterota bacterium]